MMDAPAVPVNGTAPGTSPILLNVGPHPADDQGVMVRVCVAEWSEPTRSQRAVILLLSHLLTLLGLVAWSVGTAAPATTAPAVVAVPLTVHVSASAAPGVASDAAPTRAAAVPIRPVAIVVNTSGHGVWLRREPAGEGLGIWPDGTPMTVVGPARAAEGRDWQQVRAADGQLGWVAAEYLAGSADAALMGEVGLMTPAGFAPAATSSRVRPPTSGQAVG
jgi:hypothetical protein